MLVSFIIDSVYFPWYNSIIGKEFMEDIKQETNNSVETGKITDSSISRQKHVVEMPNNGKTIDIDKDCYFGPKNKASKFFVKLCYGLASGILFLYCKAILGIKVKGKENYKEVAKKGKGVVTVSNHVHIMDTALVAASLMPRYTQFTSIESNFAIPVAGGILSFFGTIPLPQDTTKMRYVIAFVSKALKEGKRVHFFPEGVLLPYNNDLKEFNKGAFMLAAKTESPIVPIVFTQRKAKGLFKYLKKHRCSFTAHVLPAQYVDNALPKRDSVKELSDRVKNMMNETIEKYDEKVVTIDYSEFDTLINA